MVIQPGLCEQIDDAAAGACLGVRGAIDDAGHARVLDRAGAHRARLKGHIERAIVQPVVAEQFGRSTNGLDFRVRRRIGIADGLIEAGCQYLAIPDHYRADRNFAQRPCVVRLVKRQSHVGFVVRLIDRRRRAFDDFDRGRLPCQPGLFAGGARLLMSRACCLHSVANLRCRQLFRRGSQPIRQGSTSIVGPALGAMNESRIGKPASQLDVIRAQHHAGR
jgi:hypothetical protein